MPRFNHFFEFSFPYEGSVSCKIYIKDVYMFFIVNPSFVAEIQRPRTQKGRGKDIFLPLHIE